MINSFENIEKNSNEGEIIRNDRKEEISNEILELEEKYTPSRMLSRTSPRRREPCRERRHVRQRVPFFFQFSF